jgi:hypothetical protein
MHKLLIVALIAAPSIATAADLTVGQTLACNSKDPGKQLFAVVGRLDPLGPRTAVSVTIYNRAPGAIPNEMAHIPLDLAALTATCAPTSKVSLPLSGQFEGGYATWRAAVQTQGAGAFTLSIDEIDDMIRQQIAAAQHAGPKS